MVGNLLAKEINKKMKRGWIVVFLISLMVFVSLPVQAALNLFGPEPPPSHGLDENQTKWLPAPIWLYGINHTLYFNETALNLLINDTDTWWPILGPYLFNNSGYLDFNEIKLNETIDNKIVLLSVTYNASNVSLVKGTLDGGDLSSIQECDGNTLNISETPGVPGWELTVSFTGVFIFNKLYFLGQYSGGQGHVVYLQLYNNVTSSWDTIDSITDQALMGALLPFGDYKGSALALVVEILTKTMFDIDVHDEKKAGRGFLFIFFDPKSFIDIKKFKTNVSKMADEIKHLRKEKGVDEIFIPGERSEKERIKNRKKDYLDIDEKIIKEIRELV